MRTPLPKRIARILMQDIISHTDRRARLVVHKADDAPRVIGVT
jgi:hypothetical protein